MIAYLRVGALVLLVSSLGASYYLWNRNTALRRDIALEQARNQVLQDARVRDAIAAKKLIEAVQASQARLLARLTALGDIQDETGRTYLNTPVPDSVKLLLNR